MLGGDIGRYPIPKINAVSVFRRFLTRISVFTNFSHGIAVFNFARKREMTSN